MTESPNFIDEDEEALPGELLFDQELDFNDDEFGEEFKQLEFDFWKDDEEDLESDDDY